MIDTTKSDATIAKLKTLLSAVPPDPTVPLPASDLVSLIETARYWRDRAIAQARTIERLVTGGGQGAARCQGRKQNAKEHGHEPRRNARRVLVSLSAEFYADADSMLKDGSDSRAHFPAEPALQAWAMRAFGPNHMMDFGTTAVAITEVEE